MSSPKEPNFFVEDRTPEEVNAFIAEVFPGAADDVLIGEGSTSYSMFPIWRGVPERLAEHNPDLRIIYSVRDPVARIESNLAHSWLAWIIDEIDLRTALANPSYVNRTRYWLQLSRYLDCFPREQVHVVVFEDYLRAPADEMRAICEFLGPSATLDDSAAVPWRNPTIDRPGASRLEHRLPKWAARRMPPGVRQTLRRRSGRRLAGSPRLSAADAQVLRDLLRSDVEALGEFLERDLVSLWSPKIEEA
jgi:hypothetical protein